MDIQWDRPEVQVRYEDMVAVLIKRLHPDAERIDGSGGDGGRDVRVPTPGGPLIYELKSFAGRLSEGGRKSQIVRSLAKAAGHGPTAWRLVVPIDPTPGESEWFTSATGEYPFPCEWYGKTWLDSEMAKRPDIARYFLEGYQAEVLGLVRELLSEDVDPGDALEIVNRVRDLATRLDGSDPYYRYHLAIGAQGERPAPGAVLSVHLGDDRVDVIPKFRTALKDRPITVNATFEFSAEDDELREGLDRTLDFGDPVELPPEVVRSLSIDAPGGLSADHPEGGSLFLGAAEEVLVEPIPVFSTVLAPDAETPLSTHEFTMTRRRAGRRGAVLEGVDLTGLITLELRVDVEERRLNSNITFSARPVLPAVGIAAAQWIAAMTPPNLLVTRIGSPEGPAAEAPIEEPLGNEALLNIYEAFHALQERAKTPFEVPDDLTSDEIAQVMRVASWLSPEKFQFRWTHESLELSIDSADALEEVLGVAEGALVITVDVSFEFRERILPLGRLARTLESVVAVNAHEIREAVQRGETELSLELEPGNSDVAYEWLLSPGAALPTRVSGTETAG